MKIIRTRVTTHNNKKRVLLIFDYDLIQQRKEVAGGFESGGSL